MLRLAEVSAAPPAAVVKPQETALEYEPVPGQPKATELYLVSNGRTSVGARFKGE